MTDDNVIRVPRVIRTGPCSAISIWPPDEDGIVSTTFHSLARPKGPAVGGDSVMNIDAIRAAIRPAVRSEDLFEACRIMERAAGIKEPLAARRFEEMSSGLAIMWFAYEIECAESLRYWLVVEPLWLNIKIKSERISQVPG